jgi:hypothetical protein
VADVIREASYYASQEDSLYTSAGQVRQAIEQRDYRSSLIQDRIREMIEQGVIKIQVSGEQIGQVNGLSVFELGNLFFGQPNRITASVALGLEGVIDIERRGCSGRSITTRCDDPVRLPGGGCPKAPLLISPPGLQTNCTGVEGDSASSTGLYALPHAGRSSGQTGIAVTVDQQKAMQPSAVLIKRSGLFRRLPGQGWVVKCAHPGCNAENRCSGGVVQAVRDGLFHIGRWKTSNGYRDPQRWQPVSGGGWFWRQHLY